MIQSPSSHRSLTTGAKRARQVLAVLCLLFLLLSMSACTADSPYAAPGVTLSVEPNGQPKEVTTGVQLLVLLTVLSLAPAILILATSFTRIIIVLSMLRSAIGTPTIPPNQVITGLALLMTFFIMSPVYQQVDDQAIQPYMNQQIDQKTAFELAAKPVREFMFAQTREKDLSLFLEMAGKPAPNSLEEIETSVLFPAFVISELRTAFIMGFVIYIPFLVIDLVVSSVLLSLGMMMLPPSLVSLPFKMLLFIMIDGWYLITHNLALSFLS